MRGRLTDYVHEVLRARIQSGDKVIDATVGNGYDFEFLLSCGAEVVGFDVQEAAIKQTRKRVGNRGLLYPVCHSKMGELVPRTFLGGTSLVMFNLGYLPGSDKVVKTRVGTTLEALDSAKVLLKTGGLISVVAYPGHEGGGDELEGVLEWASENGSLLEERRTGGSGPIFFLIQVV